MSRDEGGPSTFFRSMVDDGLDHRKQSRENRRNDYGSDRFVDEPEKQRSGRFRGRWDRRNEHRGYDRRMDQPNETLSSEEDGYTEATTEDEDEIYVVRQKHGYFSIFFSIVQTIILGLMMWQCGVAPMSINPMIGPYPDALSEWGGKNSYLILEDDQGFRMLTPILLHAGIIHLFGNVAVQLETGVFFEKEWGSVRWLIIYLSSAIASSALSVIVMPDAVSVGSSGAVMGLFGGKLAEVILRAFEQPETPEQKIGKQVRNEQCVTVTCSVIVVMSFSFIPYVDWAAHAAGCIGGFVVGWALFAWELKYVVCQIFIFLSGIGLIAVTYGGLVGYMYYGDLEVSEELKDVCGYYEQNFEDYECNCMREQYMRNQE